MRIKLVVGALVILAIAVGLNMNRINDLLSSKTEYVNVPQATSTEPVKIDEMKIALDEIKVRPDVQKKFDSYVEEVYLTEVREKKAKELEEAEAKLDAHRAQHTSF